MSLVRARDCGETAWATGPPNARREPAVPALRSGSLEAGAVKVAAALVES